VFAKPLESRLRKGLKIDADQLIGLSASTDQFIRIN